MPTRRQAKADELSIRNLLRNHESLKGIVKFCTFSGQMMVQFPVPRPGITAPKVFLPRAWMDVDTTSLIEFILSEGFTKVQRGVVDHAVELEAWTQRYSRAVNVLDHLPDWDGVPRLEQFLIEVAGLEDNDYHRNVSRCFFLSIVARIMKPGCKVDTMLVLEGPQGGYKSRLLRILAMNDDWFSDSLPHNLSSKDAKQHLLGKLIIEMSEVAQMDKSSTEALKAFLSAQDDKFRPSYGRHEVTWLRQCVFVGTTNEDAYLKDVTGNRRYWPVKCGAIDLDRARRDLVQVYAEALSSFHESPVWWFENGINEYAEQEQKARYKEDVWTDRITRFIRDHWNMTPQGQECLIDMDMCLDHIDVPISDRNRSHEQRISEVLKNKGGQRVRRTKYHNQRYWTYLFTDISQL